jgi:hypothetical protein
MAKANLLIRAIPLDVPSFCQDNKNPVDSLTTLQSGINFQEASVIGGPLEQGSCQDKVSALLREKRGRRELPFFEKKLQEVIL